MSLSWNWDRYVSAAYMRWYICVNLADVSVLPQYSSEVCRSKIGGEDKVAICLMSVDRILIKEENFASQTEVSC